MTTEDVTAFFQKTPKTQSIPYDAVRLAATSPTGSVIFWGVTQKCIILPPFPLKEKYITNGYETEPLLSLLSKDYTIGIVLVRLGHFSVGVCQGEKLILHDSGTGLVHGRHRQGGSSAARFQRRRQDQTHHFLERVSEHLQEKLEPYARTLDYLFTAAPESRFSGYRNSVHSLHSSMTAFYRRCWKFKTRVFLSWRKLSPIFGQVK